MNLPRLLLADDHPGTRNLLRSLLESEFHVVADVADGQALITAARRLSPDVIVTDISMPGVDGITAATTILLRDPTARIVLVTVHSDTSLIDRALSSGALGYVLKERPATNCCPPFTRHSEANVTPVALSLFPRETMNESCPAARPTIGARGLQRQPL